VAQYHLQDMITGRLISEKLNNIFVEKNYFSNHEIVNLVKVFQIVFCQENDFLKIGMFFFLFI